MRRELEICVETTESARAAVAGGADRLEVCSALGVGGLTPKAEWIRALRGEIELPVHVLIRPRAGGFVYEGEEKRRMLKDVEAMVELGCAGIVIGALTSRGTIDGPFVAELVDAAEALPCTFHRAVDCVAVPSDALVQLGELGIERVLSSGGMERAIDGAVELAKMRERAPAGLRIMVGAGVNSGNLRELLRQTGLMDFHASASSAGGKVAVSIPRRVSFENQKEASGRLRATSEEEVRAMRAILDAGDSI